MDRDTSVRESLSREGELRQRICAALMILRAMARDDAPGQPRALDGVELLGRIGALGRVLLLPADGGIDLEALLRDELFTHAVLRQRTRLAGPALRLRGRAAQVLGIAIHELATLAAGRPLQAQSNTRVEVGWELLGAGAGRTLRLQWWSESDRAVVSECVQPRGAAGEWMQRLIVRELRGRAEMLYLPFGVRCALDLPATEALHT
jgi:hypothetical protein